MSKQKAANSQLISKIFTSRKIILDLAKERGYNTDEYDDFTINEIFRALKVMSSIFPIGVDTK